jgi:tryptophan-rich sensory protein
MHTPIAYLISFAIVSIVMALPNQVTMRSVNSPWYTCTRASFTPPKFVFPIVWTTLYIFIAITLAQTILLKESDTKSRLLGLYAFNLILNVAWSFAFFGEHNVLGAFIILLALIGSAGMILWKSRRVLPPWVSYLLVPYVAWLCFAGVLNGASLLNNC